MSKAAMISIRELSKSFGGVRAVSDVSFDLDRGQVTALIGPNGAGKTTLINLVTGVWVPERGTISLDGQDVTRMPPNGRATVGIARTYQTPQMARGMSVLTNVMAGAYRFGGQGFLSSMIRPWRTLRENAQIAERASACLKRVGVSEEWWDRSPSDLPYGHQRRVEIARALAQEPKALLLDEPAAGLNPSEALDLGALLVDISSDGTAVLLVEHDMGMVMSISSHIVVLNFGRKLTEGTPKEVSENREVVEAYLGAPDEEIGWQA